VNLGSLDKDIEQKYGRSAKALLESAKKHVKILEDLNFYEIVISLKASNVPMAIEAYRLASQEFSYPLHIGITEAGNLRTGTIKSSIGL
jgi:(E)-4-hydroxy-3-methylbut-2-enyl-diphosphate synthase